MNFFAKQPSRAADASVSKLSHSVRGALWLLGIASLTVAGSARTAPLPDHIPVPDALRTATEMLPDLMPPMHEAMPLFDAAIGGRPGSIRMTGLYAQRSFTFGVMRDEVVSDASITLILHPSPTLRSRSAVNVVLNDHLIGTVQLVAPAADGAKNDGKSAEGKAAQDPAAAQAERTVKVTLPVDGRALRGYNRIDLNFEGSYADACENPLANHVWVELDPASTLNLSVQRLRNPNELTYLPGPFVSKNTRSQQTLPVAFAANPSAGELEAAGIIASWAGREAEWRGIRLPAYINEAPVDAHFVTFMTAKHRPDFLKDLPEPKGPGVSIVNAPFSLWAKMLVISGRDEADLKAAASALATGSAIFSGDSVTLTDLPPVAKRAPYDAPRWLPTDRPVTLGELTTYKGQLSTRGIEPAPVHLPFRLPPDLYTFERQSVPLKIATHATPPAPGGSAQLRVRLNNAMVAASGITGKDASNGKEESLMRFSAMTPDAGRWDSIGVPGVYLKAENDLEIDFRYSTPVSSGTVTDCRYALPSESQGDIDPNSTIDFSGFYHYAVLPDLNRFTRAGYPFTIHADLATTTVVVPDKVTATDLGVYLTTLARFGAQTGAPATALTVKTAGTFDPAGAADVIYVGAMPANASSVEAIREAMKAFAKAPAQRQNVLNEAPMSAIVGMENPAKKGHSMVALLSGNPDMSKKLITMLATPAALNEVSGGTALITGGDVRSFEARDTYSIGELPWSAKVWAKLSSSPVWMVCAALLAAIVLGAISYILMRLRIRARLAIKEKDHE